jgi:hypothetical protein
MSNIDFELQDGNPAAVAISFHVALLYSIRTKTPGR